MELQESKVLKVQPELMASQDIKEKTVNQAHQAQEVTYMIFKFEFKLKYICSKYIRPRWSTRTKRSRRSTRPSRPSRSTRNGSKRRLQLV